ncbi:MAG TPA: nuclear transport factor 2 family protein [Myxococcota bacterium]|nr:nuclear transport factor 2 family protein [Myxococcota bacterium]
MTAPSEDFFQIQQVLYAYARAIDAKDWKSLERVFTPDARIHYALERGAQLRFPELGPWLARAMTIFKATQHVISNPSIELRGDTASSTAYLVATHVQVRPDGTENLTTEGGRYTDTWQRTAEGWRIATRKLERIWVDGSYLVPPEIRLFPAG